MTTRYSPSPTGRHTGGFRLNAEVGAHLVTVSQLKEER
jgi:hypothetical protein